MSKKNSLARMDRVSLLELLCQLTEENETLNRRVQELEEANANLALRDHELTARAEQAEAMREEILRLEQENAKLKEELAAKRGAMEIANENP